MATLTSRGSLPRPRRRGARLPPTAALDAPETGSSVRGGATGLTAVSRIYPCIQSHRLRCFVAVGIPRRQTAPHSVSREVRRAAPRRRLRQSARAPRQSCRLAFSLPERLLLLQPSTTLVSRRAHLRHAQRQAAECSVSSRSRLPARPARNSTRGSRASGASSSASLSVGLRCPENQRGPTLRVRVERRAPIGRHFRRAMLIILHLFRGGTGSRSTTANWPRTRVSGDERAYDPESPAAQRGSSTQNEWRRPSGASPGAEP